MTVNFDDEFASPADYARIYRSFGMQVVPAFYPEEVKAPGSWKRPNVGEWKQYTSELTTTERFEKWYGPGGMYASRKNMGIITGVGPKRIVVIDLDTHANPKAQEWWDGIHAEHNYGIMTETVAQRTGGGGFQYFFLCPEGWTCPTNKNPTIGVDSRGHHGFAVLPPSKHASGNHYEWLEGLAPWETDIAVMPEWMCREVEAILGVGVSQAEGVERTRTSTPEYKVDPLGAVLDGREDLMTRVVFRAVLEMYRESPIFPTEEAQAKAKRKAFESYDDSVDSRIREPGTPKHILLEREGRGISLFNQKWQATIRRWDEKIAREASRPWEHDEPKPPFSEKIKVEDPDQPVDIYRVWDKKNLEEQPPVTWIWDGAIVDGGSHYFAADPGVGKSFVGMGLSFAITTGMDSFLGRKVNKHGVVIYITTEGLYDHYNRLRAFEIEYGVEVPANKYFVIPDAMNLLSERDRSKLLRTIGWMIKKCDEKPVLIVIDTLSRVIPGAKENDQPDMSIFVAAKGEIKAAFDTTDLVMHHKAKNGESAMRGSTTLLGEADGIFTFERKPGEEEIVMVAAKVKAGPDGWEIMFLLKEIEVAPFTTSLVPVLPQRAPKQERDFGGKQETGFVHIGPLKVTIVERDAVLTSIKEDWENMQPWSLGAKNKNQPKYAFRRLRQILQKRITDSTAREVFEDLITKGVLSENIRNKKENLKGLQLVQDIRRNG